MKISFLERGLLVMIILSLLTGCANKSETKATNGYIINGYIQGTAEGMVYLEASGEGQKIIDSAIVTKGEFVFKGNVREALMHTIREKGKQSRTEFILDNEMIDIKAKKDSLSTAKITGAKTDSIYKTFYQNEFSIIQSVAFPIYQFSDSLYKIDALDSNIKKGELSLKHKTIMDEKWKNLDTLSVKLTSEYVANHKDDIGAILVIEDRFIKYPNPEVAKELYATLTPKVKASFYGKRLEASLETFGRVAIGAVAPDFSQETPEGEMISLSDFRGKYVFVDFWASWCGPCRKENPNVVIAYNKYKDKGLEVLGVSLDDKKDKWLQAIEKDGLTWPHISDLKGFNNEAAKLYGVQAIPQNFLISPDGKIVATNLKGKELQEKLAEIFKG